MRNIVLQCKNNVVHITTFHIRVLFRSGEAIFAIRMEGLAEIWDPVLLGLVRPWLNSSIIDLLNN